MDLNLDTYLVAAMIVCGLWQLVHESLLSGDKQRTFEKTEVLDFEVKLLENQVLKNEARRKISLLFMSFCLVTIIFFN